MVVKNMKKRGVQISFITANRINTGTGVNSLLKGFRLAKKDPFV